jgi:SAM-dependent methyltransferase
MPFKKREMMTTMDTYLDLCTEVYDLSKPTPPKDAYDFYRLYAIAAQGLILEPMCGTGRFLLPLVAEGFDVHGFDGSHHMLDALQRKAKTQKLKVNVWQGLVEEVKIQNKYKLIFIPSGSFGLITDEEKAKNALKIFYDLLEKGGKLVFEIETLKVLPTQFNVWRGTMYPSDNSKFILCMFLDLPLQNNIVSTVCRYELVDANTTIKTEVEIIKVRLYEPERLKDLLREVGFNKIKMIKAFDLNQVPAQDVEIIVYECEK